MHIWYKTWYIYPGQCPDYLPRDNHATPFIDETMYGGLPEFCQVGVARTKSNILLVKDYSRHVFVLSSQASGETRN